jgi:3'(2'), 5'-bisphosphate nucleotidase
MWWTEKNSNTELQALLAHGGMTQQSLLSDLLGLMDEASAIAREYYRKADELDVIKKGDSTPLTEADTALHHLITGHLRSMVIGLPVLSEESALEEIAARRTWKACWIVDPLDGTKEFIEKTDQFTINVSLVIDGRAELGIISIPCLHEHWVGIVGNGAAIFSEGKGLSGRAVETHAYTPPNPLVMLASHRHAPKRVEALMSSLTASFGEVHRLNSGSAVKFCDVVSGAADVYPRTSPCSEWDVAAGDALVRAAGGSVTDREGQQILYNQRESLLAQPFVAAADPMIDFAQIIFADR